MWLDHVWPLTYKCHDHDITIAFSSKYKLCQVDHCSYSLLVAW